MPLLQLILEDRERSYEREKQQGTCSLKVGYIVPDGGKLTPACDVEALG